MKKGLLTLIILGIFLSCKTLDLEPKMEVFRAETDGDFIEKTEEEYLIEELQAEIEQEKQIIFIERPVYIPTPEVSEKKPVGVESVQRSTESGTIRPEDYSHAARLYTYHPDQVYEVYTQVLRTTDIYLEPGEMPLTEPFISDRDRWVLGAGVSQEAGLLQQHIYIKPTQAGLEASLIINTDRRVYHFILRSYSGVYMPIVKFDYINHGFPSVFIQDLLDSPISLEQGIEFVDPRFLSFDYKIRYNVFRKPRWIPEKVYDDGKKTYILFPRQMLQMEAPAIFENRNEIINYTVKGNLYIIDKLIEKITIKYSGQNVTIEKKRR